MLFFFAKIKWLSEWTNECNDNSHELNPKVRHKNSGAAKSQSHYLNVEKQNLVHIYRVWDEQIFGLMLRDQFNNWV